MAITVAKVILILALGMLAGAPAGCEHRECARGYTTTSGGGCVSNGGPIHRAGQ